MGKAIANGYPISMTLGKRELLKAAAGVFCTGTYWTSPVPMIAAYTCFKELERLDAINHMTYMGELFRKGLEELARSHQLEITVSGPSSIPFMRFTNDHDLYQNQVFSAEMAKRGIYLHPYHNWFISAAHQREDIVNTLEIADIAFKAVKRQFY
jgi:glutamate-1-semialdehyde 2,1-aminomutase